MLREVLFGWAFLVASIGAAADLWARDRAYYAELAREERLEERRFHLGSEILPLSLGSILEIDAATRSYVLGERETEGDIVDAFYNPNERAHLRDVRAVFAGVRLASVVAALVMVLAGLGVERRHLGRAVLVAAGLVLLLGAAAAVAFEPLFLLFHQVFFPQGNFLFDPSRDNLVLVYPEAYWLGVTLRLGATVVLLALAVAAFTRLPIRSSAVAVLPEGKRVE